MGTIGATFFVIGIGFLYMATGTLNMADLAERIADRKGANRTVKAAFAFMYRRHGPESSDVSAASVAAHALMSLHRRR